MGERKLKTSAYLGIQNHGVWILLKRVKRNFFSIKSLIIREPARDTVQSRAEKKKEKNLNGSKPEKAKEYISDGLKTVLPFRKHHLVVYSRDLVGGTPMKPAHARNEAAKDLQRLVSDCLFCQECSQLLRWY